MRSVVSITRKKNTRVGLVGSALLCTGASGERGNS